MINLTRDKVVFSPASRFLHGISLAVGTIIQAFIGFPPRSVAGMTELGVLQLPRLRENHVQ
ncbi:MAG: hypothetical protein Q8O44_00360, partial [Syntrophales bacterium]|nr:hypothetical protein [Syntrophales bacterium]